MQAAAITHGVSAGFARLELRDRRTDYKTRHLPEAILHAAWRRAGRSGLALKSSEGNSYRVVYPGRPAGGQGPDFVDAIIETEDGSRLCGDIEIHVRPSDWRSHGHASDARYNGVLFHVALADSAAQAVTLSGRAIPLLVMSQADLNRAGPPNALASQKLPTPFLDMGRAGDERFANRSEGYLHDIQAVGVEQAIYECLMDCMGFPRNRAGFRRLARRLPWAVLERWVHRLSSTRPQLEEGLAWAAGLGPRPAQAPTLSGHMPDWVSQPGRPDNRPARRVRGMALLLGRMVEAGGPATYCVDAISEPDTRRLADRFTVTGDGGRALVGRSRASEIVVDAVLPFVHALGAARRDTTLSARALRHYRDHPALAQNSLLREASLVLSSMIEIPRRPGAREQQGLIHVYRMITTRIVRSRQLPLV